jgi:hypothetical protein
VRQADIPDVTRAFRWLLVALLGWWTVRFVAHPLDAGVVNGSFLHLVNLPFHEAGHVLFAPFGALLMALGGSLLQVMVPVACTVALLQRQDAFGAWVCGWWAGQNLIDLAPYIADARALQLVLLGGMTGAEVEGHDWEFILQSLGWLHLDRRIALTAHIFGSLAMASAVAGAAWCAWHGTGTSPATATGVRGSARGHSIVAGRQMRNAPGVHARR